MSDTARIAVSKIRTHEGIRRGAYREARNGGVHWVKAFVDSFSAKSRAFSKEDFERGTRSKPRR